VARGPRLREDLKIEHPPGIRSLRSSLSLALSLARSLALASLAERVAEHVDSSSSTRRDIPNVLTIIRATPHDPASFLFALIKLSFPGKLRQSFRSNPGPGCVY